MKTLLFAGVLAVTALVSSGATHADAPRAPALKYSPVPGSEMPLLRLARQDAACMKNACKAQEDQCNRTHSTADCKRYGDCMQSVRETGECDF